MVSDLKPATFTTLTVFTLRGRFKHWNRKKWFKFKVLKSITLSIKKELVYVTRALVWLWLITVDKANLCRSISSHEVCFLSTLPFSNRNSHWKNSQRFIRAGITEVWIHSLSEPVHKSMHVSFIDRVEEWDAASVAVQQHSDALKFLLKLDGSKHLICQALPIFPLVVAYMPYTPLWEDFSVFIRRLGDHADGPGRAVSHLDVPAVFTWIKALRTQDTRIVRESQWV